MRNVQGMSTALLAFVAIIVIGGATVGLYVLFTAPRSIASLTVSFGTVLDVERREFSVPILHDTVQVEVVVNSGNLLWTASILQQEDVLWTHAAHQGGQMTYQSPWVQLPSGNYNLTFATAGIGSLDVEIKVTSKGGVW